MKIQSNWTPLIRIPLPDRLFIPLKQHFGTEGELCVKKGDNVLRGQKLTLGHDFMLPVHASTSGEIVDVSAFSVTYPSIFATSCVVIDTDGKDKWIERDSWKNYYIRSKESLIERIHQYGIAGLGGSGFPTGIKLCRAKNKIETLIINAAECDPYINSDNCLIQECAIQIIEGIRILMYILNPKEVMIGIEDNKSEAIFVLRKALEDNHDIHLRVIPTKYPSGEEKQLVQTLTGKQIPSGKHSSDIGVLVQNVSTTYAIKRAVIDGEPLTERIVTITGKAIPKPTNIWTRLGTSISYLLKQIGAFPDKKQIVKMGGQFMGFILPRFDLPIVKVTNCLIVSSSDGFRELKKERNCIRCGVCANVCPMNLLPQQLYWFSRKIEQCEKIDIYNLSDCIECGICDWVCPSNIPLVKYFRRKKSEINDSFIKKRRADLAKTRFKARQARLKQYKKNPACRIIKD